MFKGLKSLISFILQQVLIVVAPSIYKKRYLGNYLNLSWHQYDPSKIEYEMLLVKYFLKTDSVFFDVGSNIGSFVVIANKTIPAPNIYGFEPIPKLNSRLRVLFPDSHISSIALSNIKKNTQFKIPKINNTHLLTRGTLNTSFTETNEQSFITLDVKTDTLDNFTSDNKILNIDLIKIDVEGHEFEVIKGGVASLKKYKPVLIIEIEQRHHQPNINVIIDAIKMLDYHCFYFDSNTFKLVPLLVDPATLQQSEHFEKSRMYVHNFIFVHTDKVNSGYCEEVNTAIAADRLQ